MSVRFSSSELSILLSIQQIVHKRWKKTEHKRIESIACVALDICASIFRFLPSHDFFPNSSTFSLLFVVFFMFFLAYYFVIIIVFDRLFNRGAHISFPRRSLFIPFETHVPSSLTNILLRLFVCVSQSIENWFAHHCHQCTVIFSYGMVRCDVVHLWREFCLAQKHLFKLTHTRSRSCSRIHAKVLAPSMDHM